MHFAIHVKVGLPTILLCACPKSVIKWIVGFRIDDLRIEKIILVDWLIIRTLGVKGFSGLQIA